MKILFWLEPHFELMRPGVMSTWLHWFKRIGLALNNTEADFEYMIASLDLYPHRRFEEDLKGRVVLLSQAELLAQWRLTGTAFMELEHDRVPNDICVELFTILRDRMGVFEPDVVFLLNQQPWLRRGFSNALFVNIELSWISRAPYPTSWQLDIAGAGKGRLLADCTSQVLEACDVSENLGFVDTVRLYAKNHLTSSRAESFVSSLRQKFSTVKLLPIGIFDYFDGVTPFFAVLDKFLGEQDAEAALILTQYPEWPAISSEQLTYLTDKYTYLVDGDLIGSQYLLPLVDFVIGDFSTVGSQALFFDTRVVSVRSELNNFPIDTPLHNRLVDILAGANSEQRRKMLHWLLMYYAIPEQSIFDGVWLSRFLRKAVEAIQIGQPWTAYDEPSSTVEDWDESRWRAIPVKSTLDSEARLYFSEIVDGTSVVYSESRSVGLHYPVSGHRQTLNLKMPSDLRLVEGIRLDFANSPLAIRLHGLTLIDANGAVLWCWNGHECAFEKISGCTIRQGDADLMFVSLNDDPHFDLAVPVEVLNSLKSNGKLVVDFTPMPLQEVVSEVLIGDDQQLAELRSKLKEALSETCSLLVGSSSLPVNLSSDLEALFLLIKESLARRDQKISEQADQMVSIQDELLRAEAQLDLLKDLILHGREEGRL